MGSFITCIVQWLVRWIVYPKIGVRFPVQVPILGILPQTKLFGSNPNSPTTFNINLGEWPNWYRHLIPVIFTHENFLTVTYSHENSARSGGIRQSSSKDVNSLRTIYGCVTERLSSGLLTHRRRFESCRIYQFNNGVWESLVNPLVLGTRIRWFESTYADQFIGSCPYHQIVNLIRSTKGGRSRYEARFLQLSPIYSALWKVDTILIIPVRSHLAFKPPRVLPQLDIAWHRGG